MLRLLFLFLILRGAAATSEDTEGNYSGDDIVDDEDGDGPVETRRIQYAGPEEIPKAGPGSDKSTGDDEDNEGGTLIIIIAAVSVIVLAIGGIVAIFLFRRYLQSREQGLNFDVDCQIDDMQQKRAQLTMVYSVPAEQGQKAAV